MSDERDLDAAGQPPPAWARPGTVVRYRPHVGCDPWYLGEITSEPRLLGGTWVVRLGRMEAAYNGGAGCAPAAWVDALEPVAELAGRVAELEAHLERVARLPSMDEARAGAAIMQVAATLARRGDSGLARTLRDAVDRWRAHVAQERLGRLLEAAEAAMSDVRKGDRVHYACPHGPPDPRMAGREGTVRGVYGHGRLVAWDGLRGLRFHHRDELAPVQPGVPAASTGGE